MRKKRFALMKGRTYRGELKKHLKEDIDDIYFDLDGVAVKGSTYYLTVEDIKEIAKHFFELGVNAHQKKIYGRKIKYNIL